MNCVSKISILPLGPTNSNMYLAVCTKFVELLSLVIFFAVLFWRPLVMLRQCTTITLAVLANSFVSTSQRQAA